MKKSLILALLSAPALVLSGPDAKAHQFWYQMDQGALTFLYGDMDFNMREVSPGGLDKIANLQTRWVSPAGSSQVQLVKRQDSLALPTGMEVGAQDTLVSVDLEYPMFNTKRDGNSLRTYWVPATRWVGNLQSREPELTLDIVPTGLRDGHTYQFQVTYLGEPLVGEPVRILVPSGWVKTIISDGEGKIEADLPWKGDYAVQLYFTDEVEGVRRLAGKEDEAYQLEGYNTTLSFSISEGVDPFPVTRKTLPASAYVDAGLAPPKHR
jgi:hypothetical protein